MYYEYIDTHTNTSYRSNVLIINGEDKQEESTQFSNFYLDRMDEISNSDTFAAFLECGEGLLVTGKLSYICRVFFNSEVTMFNNQYIFVKGGDLLHSGIIYSSPDNSTGLFVTSVLPDVNTIEFCVLSGSAQDTSGRISAESNKVVEAIHKNTFTIDLTRGNSNQQACQTGVYIFSLVTSSPVLGIPVHVVNVKGSTILYIVRHSPTKYSF